MRTHWVCFSWQKKLRSEEISLLIVHYLHHVHLNFSKLSLESIFNCCDTSLIAKNCWLWFGWGFCQEDSIILTLSSNFSFPFLLLNCLKRKSKKRLSSFCHRIDRPQLSKNYWKYWQCRCIYLSPIVNFFQISDVS